MAELTFMHGPMGCGKSMLALQTAHNARLAGRRALLFTKLDRGGGQITSRVGLAQPAHLVGDDTDFTTFVAQQRAGGLPVDLLICDEAQFYSAVQVEQLAQVVDQQHIDVTCVGLLTDFRTRLFEGSARLIELADRTEKLQVQVRCWCGQPAICNARVINGEMVRDGQQVVVGDLQSGVVSYEVLCRTHHRDGRVAAQADVCHLPA